MACIIHLPVRRATAGPYQLEEAARSPVKVIICMYIQTCTRWHRHDGWSGIAASHGHIATITVCMLTGASKTCGSPRGAWSMFGQPQILKVLECLQP